mmetsp:Transcript_17628/g.29779  ORF Transcript_17628/g.29779 Transcript_17628/m.29779 type:complete len:152 (+) Transcript_17628:1655-2110(+)
MVEVTAESLEQYCFDDVIFPIIGHKVKLPSNPEMSKIIEDIMAEDGINMQTFVQQTLLVITSASGSYRKILGRAQDIEFDLVQTQNTNEDLLTPYYNVQKDPQPTILPEETGGAVFKALRLRFSLKPSSYATMFLREVTKQNSSYLASKQA